MASKDYHECIESIKRMLWESKRKEDVKTHIGFFFISGKGVTKNGEYMMLLNEIDDSEGFYRLAKIEYDITSIARNFFNVYIVCILASNRTTFD